MEHVSKELAVISGQRLPQPTSNDKLALPRKSNAAALSEITNLINRVQIVKQIRPPLNEQMIAALALKLDKLQLPLRDLKAMADRVSQRSPTAT